MTDKQHVLDRVTNLVTDVLQTRVPSTATNLIEARILDSLGFVELIARLEQEFDVRISLDNVGIDQFRSIESIAAFVVPESAASSAS
jgi:acyl carrier protein